MCAEFLFPIFYFLDGRGRCRIPFIYSGLVFLSLVSPLFYCYFKHSMLSIFNRIFNIVSRPSIKAALLLPAAAAAAAAAASASRIQILNTSMVDKSISEAKKSGKDGNKMNHWVSKRERLSFRKKSNRSFLAKGRDIKSLPCPLYLFPCPIPLSFSCSHLGANHRNYHMSTYREVLDSLFSIYFVRSRHSSFDIGSDKENEQDRHETL